MKDNAGQVWLLVLLEVVFLSQVQLGFFVLVGKIRHPARAEVDVPTPDAAERRLGPPVVVSAKFAVLAGIAFLVHVRYGNHALRLVRMEFPVEFDRGQQAAEIALGDVRGAYETLAARRNAEFQELGEEELPSGHGHRHGLVVGIGEGEVPRDLGGGELGQRVVALDLLHPGDRLLQGASQRDEQLEGGVEIKLNDIGPDAQVPKREVVHPGRLVVHVEDLHLHVDHVGDFRLHFGDLHPGTEDGLVLCEGKRRYAHQGNHRDDSFHGYSLCYELRVLDYCKYNERNPNCKFTCSQVINTLILFPFFSIKNVANNCGSSLNSLFDCKKDMFYRTLSNDRIDWRHVVRYVIRKLLRDIEVRTDSRNSESPVCMIVDDAQRSFQECSAGLLGYAY